LPKVLSSYPLSPRWGAYHYPQILGGDGVRKGKSLKIWNNKVLDIYLIMLYNFMLKI
jgi:hypothetical protein